MKLTLKAALMLGTLVVGANTAAADCGIAAGSVRILSNDFEALRVVGAGALECASDTVRVTHNATSEHKNIQSPALTISPAEYTVAIVANNSAVPLIDEGLIRPLNDLVAQYGQSLQPSQLITIDGAILAVAFMGNSQHLFYRSDLLDQVGLGVPETYDELLVAAEAIRAAGLLEFPIAAGTKPGWDLGAEFVNMYLGTGGEFFEPGSAQLAIDNENGRMVLDTLRAMTGYMQPDYLTTDAGEMNKLWDAGQVAFVNQWGSLAGAAIDPETANPDIAAVTGFAATPRLGDGTLPSAALWWDGFTIARNISDEDAAASFQAMVHAISPERLANNTAATWLVAGYEPGPSAVGVIANAMGGARGYPMQPYMGLLHTTLSTELADFIAGTEDAEQAMADIAAAYDAAARAAGFLQ